MISNQDWARCSALLDEVLELEGPARDTWLGDLRARDADTAAQVRRLLAREEAAAAITAVAPAYEQTLHRVLSAEEARAAAVPGQCFGPWQVQQKLGEGGMGEVWLAARTDALYEGKAAIKLLRDRGDRERFEHRFARERQALARLNHPGIARLLDAGLAGDQPYLVLEHVDGQSLHEHVRATQANTIARVRLLLAVAQAVEYAHSQLIVHRDLKPSNVMVTTEGSVKLLDFGIAGWLDDASRDDSTALTRLFGRGLTLDYAAPEQITGEATGVGCDVFSLGVLLFELLSGQRPFAGRQPGRTALEHAIVHDEAVRLSKALAGRAANEALPRPADADRARGDLEAVIAKALRKNPADRYASVAAFASDLQNWLDHRPVTAGPEDWRYRSRLWLLRNRVAATLTAAVVLSLAGGLCMAIWQAQRVEQEASRKQAVQDFLVGILAAPDPLRTGNADPTMRSVVDASALRAEQELAGQPQSLLAVLGVLAQTYYSLGDFKSSLSLVDKALALDAIEESLTPSERSMLLNLSGKSFYEIGDYGKAVDRHAEAAALQVVNLGEDSPELAETRIAWAIAESQLGHLARSLELARQSLQRFERDHGSELESRLQIHYSYALILLRAGLLRQAEQQARLALATDIARYGRASGQAASSVQRLSTILVMRGAYSEADILTSEAINALEKSMPGQMFLGFSYKMRAMELAETGHPEQALPVIDKAIETFTATQGESAPNTLMVRLNKAEYLALIGDVPRALNLADEAFAALPQKNPTRQVQARMIKGRILLLAQQPQAALDLFEQALQISLEAQGPMHHYTAQAQAYVGLTELQLGLPGALANLHAADAVFALEYEPQQIVWAQTRKALAKLERSQKN